MTENKTKNWDGFVEGLTCRRCGKELSDKNGQNPAESYMGTYNGLCKECTFEDSYVVKEYFDGAKRISYKPLTPSHRRSRKKFIAYDDCDECDGKGMEKVHRVHRGSYYSYCEECLDRYHNHPYRETKSEIEDEYTTLHPEWEDDFQERTDGIDDENKVEEIAEDIWDKINEDKEKIRQVIDEKFDEAKEIDDIEKGVEHIKSARDEIEKLELNKEYKWRR